MVRVRPLAWEVPHAVGVGNKTLKIIIKKRKNEAKQVDWGQMAADLEHEAELFGHDSGVSGQLWKHLVQR